MYHGKDVGERFTGAGFCCDERRPAAGEERHRLCLCGEAELRLREKEGWDCCAP